MVEKTGSCLCGAIKIKITGAPFMTNLCHCISCQKATSSVCVAMARYRADQVEYIMSDPSVFKTYEDKTPESGAVLLRSFCANCGSAVKAVHSGFPDSFGVPMGVIDGDKLDLKPSRELFTCRKITWLPEVVGVVQHDKMPALP